MKSRGAGRLAANLLASLILHGLLLTLVVGEWEAEPPEKPQEPPVVVTLVPSPEPFPEPDGGPPLERIPPLPEVPPGPPPIPPPAHSVSPSKKPGPPQTLESEKQERPQKLTPAEEQRKTVAPEGRVRRREEALPAERLSPPKGEEAGEGTEEKGGGGGPDPGGKGSEMPGRGEQVAQADPVCIHCPPPRYPRRARRNEWEGTVLVEALVGTTGAVREIRVVEGSGYPLLDEAALEAAREWRFRPGQRDGKNAAVRVRIPVGFRLD